MATEIILVFDIGKTNKKVLLFDKNLQVISEEEDRFILIGISSNNLLLIVVHTARADNIRIISARKANKIKRKDYEKNA